MRSRSRSRWLPLVVLGTGLGFTRAASADSLAAGVAQTNLVLTTPATGLTGATAISFLPDGRFVVTAKTGEVWLLHGDGSNQTQIGMFDVDTGSEKGLLNVLVPPDFTSNHHLIFYYSASDNAGGTDLDRHYIASVPMGTNDMLDIPNQKILLRGLRGPANHDGGGLTLSPDGKYLYVSVGDTGCNSNLAPVNTASGMPTTPTNYFATCLTNANGKVLRINLDGSIPSDNPLSNLAMVTACGNNCGIAPTATNLAAPRKEIWAWGLRNPFRVWADPKTGYLWVGHVGEITFETINVVTHAGQDFGWPWREGEYGYPINQCATITPHDNTPTVGGNGDCVNPVYYYRHNSVEAAFVNRPSGQPIDGEGVAVIGGLIVDSCSWPAAVSNMYYFGDEGSEHIFALAVNSTRDGVTGSRIDIATAQVTDFEFGPDKALYYVTLDGNVGRIAPKNPIVCSDPVTGSPTPPAGSKNSGGCGCRLINRELDDQRFALALAALGLLALRRRNLPRAQPFES